MDNVLYVRKKGRFWQIGLAFGVSTGLRDSWSSMLDVNLKSHGRSQSEAGWLGFYGTVAGAFAAIFAGRFADSFQKRLRIFVLILNILAVAAYLWFVLQIMDYIPESKATEFGAFILAAIAGFVINPLFYELVCETSYPVSEGITNICLTSLGNITILVFLGFISIPNIGTDWMNWLLVSSFVLSSILLFLLPDGHNRLDIDKKGEDALKEENLSMKDAQVDLSQNHSQINKEKNKNGNLTHNSLSSK